MIYLDFFVDNAGNVTSTNFPEYIVQYSTDVMVRVLSTSLVVDPSNEETNTSGVRLNILKPDGTYTPRRYLFLQPSTVAISGTNYYVWQYRMTQYDTQVALAPSSTLKMSFYFKSGTYIKTTPFYDVTILPSNYAPVLLPEDETLEGFQDQLDYLSNLLIDDSNPLVNYIRFNVDYTPNELLDGMLYYDNQDGVQTLVFNHELANGEIETVRIGQQLFGMGKNLNGSLLAGQPVYWAGVQGDHPYFEAASASSATPEKNAMTGVLMTAADANDFAPVVVFGYLSHINLSLIMETGTNLNSLVFGSKLYLSATEAGKYTLVEPARPNASIWMATVLKVNGNKTQCTIFVNPVRQRVDGGGILIFVQPTEPTTDISGDFWYDTSANP
jgi:hypothetical protein